MSTSIMKLRPRILNVAQQISTAFPELAIELRAIEQESYREYRQRAAKQKYHFPSPVQMKRVCELRDAHPDLQMHELGRQVGLGGGAGRVSEILGVRSVWKEHPSASVAEIANLVKLSLAVTQRIIDGLTAL